MTRLPIARIPTLLAIVPAVALAADPGVAAPPASLPITVVQYPNPQGDAGSVAAAAQPDTAGTAASGDTEAATAAPAVSPAPAAMTSSAELPSAAASKPRNDDPEKLLRVDDPDALALARTGRRNYRIGSAIAWAGLAAYAGGSIAGYPEVSFPGAAVQFVGISLIGWGAGQMAGAARQNNPEIYQEPGSGALAYKTGAAIIGTAAIAMIAAPLLDDDSNERTVRRYGSLGLLAGQLVHYVAWYQFANRREAADLALASAQIVPVFTVASDRSLAPGLSLVATF